MESVGDLARTLVLRSNQMRLRQEMDQLAVEVATGIVRDPTKHLHGDTAGLQAVDRALSRLEAFRVSTAEATLISGTMQTALDEIQTRSELLSQTLISAELTPNESLLATMSEDGRNTLGQTLGSLNRSVAGRFLFSGTATAGPAVQGLEDLLVDLRTTLAGETTLAGVNARLDTFFGAGGGYETLSFQGAATGLAPLKLGETETANLDIKATDDAFRALLKPLAMAALANDDALGFDLDLQVEMLAQAGRDLLAAQQPIVELRAGLGMTEARIEQSIARNSSERTALSLARLELVGTDEFETATQYEAIRGQLESLYAITVRSQRLSLAEYL